jgi:aspartyl/glutamyl-tRNA(Asn/Gln) amidotransferase C subunit
MEIDIKSIAGLAMLDIDDDKAQSIADDMRAVVEMVSELPDCGELSDVPDKMKLRDDEVTVPDCSSSELIMNAPNRVGDCFSVPRTV